MMKRKSGREIEVRLKVKNTKREGTRYSKI